MYNKVYNNIFVSNRWKRLKTISDFQPFFRRFNWFCRKSKTGSKSMSRSYKDPITRSWFIAKTWTWSLMVSRSGLYWTRLMRFSFTGHKYSLILIICISMIKIQSPVHDLQFKQFFLYNYIFDLDLDLDNGWTFWSHKYHSYL